MALLYSAGFRVSELINLKKEDIEIERGLGWVRAGKGNKDRLFVLAEKIRELLQNHIRSECLYESSYLFKGNHFGHISRSSVQNIVLAAAKIAGIRRRIHPHTLRHSFATHLVENGYNIFTIQPLLGHSSIDATETYLHMVSPSLYQVQSPYDTL